MTTMDSEQGYVNDGDRCHIGEDCMKEGTPPSPLQKNTSKPIQQIPRKSQTLSP